MVTPTLQSSAGLMARSNTDKVTSHYYPPRARWYSPVFKIGYEIRRLLRLEKVRLPAGFSCAEVGLSLLVPGFALFANRRRLLGWIFLGVYCFSALVFVVALGYQAGGVAYGLMISAHATSIIFLETCWLRDRRPFGFRLALAGLTLLVVWLGIYAPLVGFVERHWIMPLSVRGRAVIVRRAALPRNIRRGDWVMYSLEAAYVGDGHRGGAVQVQPGFGWGPVLAVAGDRVEFSTNQYLVNGLARPLLPYLPRSGELVVAEKHWFIWPELDMVVHGNVGEASITEQMLRLASVSEDQFVGKPFHRWFWRRQISP
jgi:hypothetical protein